MADSLKDIFDAGRYRSIAAELAAAASAFDRKAFLAHTLDGLDTRELMDRMRRTSSGVALALPLSYREQLTVLRTIAPRIGHNFAGIFLSDFVAQHGLDDTAASLDALRFFTRFGSAEFAIRPFLVRDLDATLAVMREWAVSDDEHVRRLASEGCRPRLPWGERLHALVADPRPTLPILETLRADDSLYVRKSVANHLNDIAKDHPQVVLDLVASWDRSHAHTAWIVRHALRTLVKRGDTRALSLLGAGEPARVDASLSVTPRRLKLGAPLQLSASIVSRSSKSQHLVIDYVVHYARAGGSISPKVFKWKTADLPARATLTLSKRQVIRDFSMRRHYPGLHKIQLQINGRILAETSFTLSV